jgi:hypothetical protein
MLMELCIMACVAQWHCLVIGCFHAHAFIFFGAEMVPAYGAA